MPRLDETDKIALLLGGEEVGVGLSDDPGPKLIGGFEVLEGIAPSRDRSADGMAVVGGLSEPLE